VDDGEGEMTAEVVLWRWSFGDGTTQTLSIDDVKDRRARVAAVKQILSTYDETHLLVVEEKAISFKRPSDFPKFPTGGGFGKLFHEYRTSAKRKVHVFDLGYVSFLRLTQEPCYYCGQEPLQERNGCGYPGFVFNGVDRLDNAEGYTSRNSVSCCSRCNYLKGGLSEVAFLDAICKIYGHRFA